MRPDQYEQLRKLSEKVCDVAIFDSNPDNWVGAGRAAADLTKEERGNAYWCRKVAAGSLSVLGKITAMIDERSPNLHQPGNEGLLEDEIRAAEVEGARILDEIQRGNRKREFDKHVHG